MSKSKTVTLENCFSLRARIGWQGLRSDEFIDEGPYLVTGTDFINGRVNWDTCYHVTMERYKQDKGIQLHERDLLMTKDGTIGKTAVVHECPEKVTLNSGVFVVRAINNDVVPEYLYYVLMSHDFELYLRNIMTGSTIKHLNQEHFYKFSFTVPSDTKEQAKIAEVLYTVDEAIDKTRELIEKYKNIKAGLMQGLLREHMVSETLIKLGSFAKTRGGKRLPKGSELSIAPTNHPYIRVRDMTKAKTVEINDSFLYVENDVQPIISRYIVDVGDLIISIVGTVGAISIIGESLDKANLTENCAKIVDIEGYNTEFLYYYLSSAYGQREIKDGTIGEVQSKLPLKNILDLEIPAISPPEQETVVRYLNAADEKIDTEYTYLSKLQDIKLGLMQDLLTRRVSVAPLM